jgi:alkylated DNA repair dioxygenase AlkB
MTCKTLIQKNALVFEEANSLYAELVKLPWKDAVRSRNGFTRLAHQLDLESKQGEKILGIIKDVLVQMKTQHPRLANYAVFGVYINYYRDGNMYTPQHSHKGTHQLVISLGVPRTLLVGKKSIKMENGDAVLFGSSTHGVPKEVSNGGRISIATFMAPLD